jgi:hypothetical protein
MMTYLNFKNKRNRFIFRKLCKMSNTIESSNGVSHYLEPECEHSGVMSLSIEILTATHRFTFGKSLGLKLHIDFLTVDLKQTDLDVTDNIKIVSSNFRYYGLNKNDIFLSLKGELPWLQQESQKHLTKNSNPQLLTV